MIDQSTTSAEPRKLYPFQEKAVNDIFNRLIELPANANILFQLPTGGGKTIIFSEIAKRYIEKFKRKVLILTHRIELSKQTSDVLAELGIQNKVINSEVKGFHCIWSTIASTRNKTMPVPNYQWSIDRSIDVIKKKRNNRESPIHLPARAVQFKIEVFTVSRHVDAAG